MRPRKAGSEPDGRTLVWGKLPGSTVVVVVVGATVVVDVAGAKVVVVEATDWARPEPDDEHPAAARATPAPMASAIRLLDSVRTSPPAPGVGHSRRLVARVGP